RIERERLFEERSDFLARIERCEGVLEHHLHPRTQALEGFPVRGRDVVAVDAEAASRRALDHRNLSRQRRLAAARLADAGQRLARSDAERDAVERPHQALGPEKSERNRVVTAEGARFEERSRRHRCARTLAASLSQPRVGWPYGSSGKWQR